MALTTITSDTGPIELNVEESGQGRPVVLIHGWPLSGQSWSAQVEALAPHYRVVTYDRRGFGESAKPAGGYDYDTLAGDLHGLLEALDLRDVTLVGFSMGGGEVARYMSRFGADRIHSVVFAGAVPPYMAKTDDNPDGPLDEKTATQMREGLEADREAFFDDFATTFFSTPKLGGLTSTLKVSEEQRQDAIAMVLQSDQNAALTCMDAFGTTDFRGDLGAVIVPALVVHGDSDTIVPFEGSGKRTHEAIEGSRVQIIEGTPHGLAVSHAEEFNRILLDFLAV
ncbi:alpha/beta fold hydrolase [Dermacoccus sp. CCH2-D9]|uniref:alpha/beta fold hydrolase n=1 Tax=Dermacoccus sp. CCH2-D9 TaxID=1768779 RepID=UPI0007849860|nr:alpha/beta hydrolase [Dermacoccus sp. CCH2-D9]